MLPRLALLFLLSSSASASCFGLLQSPSEAPRAVLSASRGQPWHARVLAFYTKFLDAAGISVFANGGSETSMRRFGFIANMMLRKRPDIKLRLMSKGIKIAVLGQYENTTMLPEFSDLNNSADGEWEDYNTRTRGLGATWSRPVCAASEENLMCKHYTTTAMEGGDPYAGESIAIHEFAHTILSTFHDDDRTPLHHGSTVLLRDAVERAYNAAMANGLWENSYAARDWKEYWAVGSTTFHNAGQQRRVPGIYNHIHTRTALRSYDPELYRILTHVYCDDSWRGQMARCGPDSPACHFSSCAAPLPTGMTPAVIERESGFDLSLIPSASAAASDCIIRTEIRDGREVRISTCPSGPHS